VIWVTRRYRFPAAHVLSQPAFDDERNRRIFGKCANPNGHGHDYEVEVSIAGPIDPETGRIIDPTRLDRIFEETIGRRFSHHMLNDLDSFGRLVPTAENIARVIHRDLSAAVGRSGKARVAHVRLTETRRNHVDYGEST
jgi:6-pyruvoyltetrahydropterin/6-carboxytetrahydropterin synthase